MVRPRLREPLAISAQSRYRPRYLDSAGRDKCLVISCYANDNANASSYSYSYPYTYSYTHAYAHTHTYTHTYTNTYDYAYTNTNTNTYTSPHSSTTCGDSQP